MGFMHSVIFVCFYEHKAKISRLYSDCGIVEFHVFRDSYTTVIFSVIFDFFFIDAKRSYVSYSDRVIIQYHAILIFFLISKISGLNS